MSSKGSDQLLPEPVGSSGVGHDLLGRSFSDCGKLHEVRGGHCGALAPHHISYSVMVVACELVIPAPLSLCVLSRGHDASRRLARRSSSSLSCSCGICLWAFLGITIEVMLDFCVLQAVLTTPIIDDHEQR